MAKKKENNIDEILDLLSEGGDIADIFKKLFTEAFDGNEGIDSPIIYGLNVKIDDSGKPVVEKFGNVKGTAKEAKVSDEREPLVEVISKDTEVAVIAEVPGVDKKEIKVYYNPQPLPMLLVSANSKYRKYYKKVKLPSQVDPADAVAKYINGVLEITMKKNASSKAQGQEIKVA